jgi:glucose-fructose oxidoreductase
MAAIRPKRPIRYGVVGLGYFAQAAILPAFERAKNSGLVALFSSDSTKLHELGKRYEVEHLLDYEAYDEFLASGKLDAVYIALPNNLHCEYTLRAARAGVHVLCEKPMAVTEQECKTMIEACSENRVKLMIAYRLHFEKANLEAIEIAQSGKLGALRVHQSLFCMQVQQGNTRLQADLGGGPLYDIGIYCINAARYIFRDEPNEVFGVTVARTDDERFGDVEEAVSATLRFAGERIATFTASFGAHDVSEYQVVGTQGLLRVNPAFEHASDLKHELITNGSARRKTFKKRDQVAPELIHFSRCILDDTDPEPSGREGLADVRIIRAIYESARTGQKVELEPVERTRHPEPEHEMYVRPHDMPDLVHASPPSGH